jgi:hypothetical protein
VLPPIAVLPYGDAFVLRDGHHRVSVAKARGAATIDAAIEAPGPARLPLVRDAWHAREAGNLAA